MRIIKPMLACALLFAGFQAAAYAGFTFNEGVKAYEVGDFARAKLVFERLAQLGHPAAQFNLAGMHYLGEGGERDLVKAYGWFSLAEDSGRKDTRKIQDAIYKGLSPAGQKTAIEFRDSLFKSYGWKALNASLIPETTETDLRYCQVERTESPLPVYPGMMAMYDQEGWVDVEFTVSKEGYVRDLYVVEFSHKRFVAPTIKAQRRHKFTPPLVGGRNGEVYGLKQRFIFRMVGDALKFGTSDEESRYKRKLEEFTTSVLEKANAGDPYYQYFYGYIMTTHPDVKKISNFEMSMWYLKSAQGGFMPAQYALGVSLLCGYGSVPDLKKAIEWLALAAQSDYPRAQLLLGRILLGMRDDSERAEKALFWMNKAAERGFPPAIMAYAWLLAVGTDEKFRDPESALKLAAPVYKDYADQVTALETMAAAYAGMGNFKQAVTFQKKAIKEAKSLEWDLQPLLLRLEAYNSGKAWYES